MYLSNTKRILAIDPGERAGWSFFINERLAESGKINGTLENWKEIHNLLDKFNPEILIIETQFIRNPKGLVTLIERRCLWHLSALFRNMTVITIAPKSWQSYWKLSSDKKIKNKYQRTKAFKESICKKTQEMFGKIFKTDESDSALMGLFAIQTKLKKC